MYENDQRYSQLFDYVIFRNASDELFEKFVEEFDVDLLTRNMWLSACYRLSSSEKEKMNFDTRYIQKVESKQKIFNAEEGRPFQGIMNYLTNETGGNIHDNGTIEITTNPTENSLLSSHQKNLVDYMNENRYMFGNNEEIFICFDFKDKLVQLTDYTLRSNNISKNIVNLRNWVIECTNDNYNWCTN